MSIVLKRSVIGGTAMRHQECVYRCCSPIVGKSSRDVKSYRRFVKRSEKNNFRRELARGEWS